MTGASSVILIVLGPSRTFWSATSQESVHQMDVVEMMILECAVGHVRKSSCRFSLSHEVLAAKDKIVCCSLQQAIVHVCSIVQTCNFQVWISGVDPCSQWVVSKWLLFAYGLLRFS